MKCKCCGNIELADVYMFAEDWNKFKRGENIDSIEAFFSGEKKETIKLLKCDNCNMLQEIS